MNILEILFQEAATASYLLSVESLKKVLRKSHMDPPQIWCVFTELRKENNKQTLG